MKEIRRESFEYAPETVLVKVCCQKFLTKIWAVFSMLSRSWSQRIWVIQELVLAKEFIFVLGSETIGKKDFACTFRLVNDLAPALGIASITNLLQFLSTLNLFEA